jgi:hypothetical protein
VRRTQTSGTHEASYDSNAIAIAFRTERAPAAKVNETTAFKIKGVRAESLDAMGEAAQQLGVEACPA